ncbi:MAG: Two-component sensor histidine kinase [Frankiales bacterium]|nr:Two-component sensor histidine kinase [Frankiales bacterium]
MLLEGRLRLLRLVDGEDLVVNETDQRGAYAGAVRSYVSVDEPYGNTVVAAAPSRFFLLPAQDFADFMREQLPMAVHLLDGLYLGLRSTEAQVRQREHLADLGSLSANLAHELNNLAAATVRATAQLRERVAGMRHKLGAIAAGRFDPEVLARLVALQEETVERAATGRAALSPVEQADREDELSDRLDELGVAGGYDLAPVLVTAGLDAAWVDQLVELFDGAPDGPLRWISYTLETEALMDEIQDASTRISTLVAAVKQYSHMDAATHADVDLHPGLDSTVVMLGHKLAGIEVRREYDRDLPTVPAYGAELNQVWTNLIDNAADAMGGSRVLVLRTRDEPGSVVVEVADDGPGIPDGVRERVFEAFFTTKDAGRGSGLGLDNARRIVVQRHHGSLDLATSSAGTTFTVRLPKERP